MKQTKHIWWTFSPWEADALRQYLEQLALEGWYPESIGTIGMKCRLGEPEKRRYAAVLAPKTSVLTGADSWDAGKFRERCEAAGWKLQCSGTNWQIFYTTDETLELTEEMRVPWLWSGNRGRACEIRRCSGMERSDKRISSDLPR